MKYQLISSGRLLAGFEEKKSVARIQRITKLSEEQVRKSLLRGRSRKLLISDDKEKIRKAALTLRKAGLDVTVDIRCAGPGTIAVSSTNAIEKQEKERIDFLPRCIESAKKKSRCRRYLMYLLLFLFILAGLLLMTIESSSDCSLGSDDFTLRNKLYHPVTNCS